MVSSLHSTQKFRFMKKLLSLLLVSLVAFMASGCAGLNQKLAQYHIRQGWQGPSMTLLAPDYKPSWNYDVPAKVNGGDMRLTVNSGYGYSMSASRTEHLSLRVTPSMDYGLPRVDFSRSINNSFYESDSYTPMPPQMTVVPQHYPSASGYIPLKSMVTPLK